MPHATLTDSAARLRDATLGLVWRQWAALGAQVSANGVSEGIVDPESLVFVSLALLPHERRLADVLASWITLHSSLLSIQRLRNLSGDYPPAVLAMLPAVAAVGVSEARDARWKSLASPAAPAPLGARPGKLRSADLRFTRTATLVLQLRRGMGVGVKADVVAYLLGVWGGRSGRNWARASTIAAATGYTKVSVRQATDDLAAARFIRPLETMDDPAAAQRMYEADPDPWMSLLGLGNLPIAAWRSWRERFAFVAAVLAAAESMAGREVTDYALAVTVRELLETHRSTLTRDRLLAPGQYAAADFGEPGDWVELFETAVRELASWMDAQQ